MFDPPVSIRGRLPAHPAPFLSKLGSYPQLLAEVPSRYRPFPHSLFGSVPTHQETSTSFVRTTGPDRVVVFSVDVD
jgi:hypothetical protein